MRDLVKAALIQSANDAAYALAAYAGGGDVTAFVREMNDKARALKLRDTHFVRPDGLDAPNEHSSAADVTRLARIAMRNPEIRDIVRERSDTIAGGRTLHTWNDLLGAFRGLIGVKTGHTGAAGWCQVAAARRPGFTVYTTILGSPSREQRNADLAALLRWGLSRYRVSSVIRPGRTYALAQAGYGRGPLELVAKSGARRAVRVDKPLVARIVAAAAVGLPVRAGERLGVIRLYSGKRLVVTRPLVASRSIERPGSRRARRLLRGAHAEAHRVVVHLIVTVTLNAALDRTLTVPNFQRGQRHRASAGLTLAGGKGINVARTLKALDVPVVATGLVGGRTGTRIVEDLTTEAILNDFVRIGDESRTSTMVVDPAGGTSTEIYEWGPLVEPRRARHAAREDRLPRAGGRPRRPRRLAAAGRRRQLLRRGDPRARAPARPRRARRRRRAAAVRCRS